MKDLIFEEINDAKKWQNIYYNEVKPLIDNPTENNIRELVLGLSNVTLSYQFDVQLKKDLNDIRVIQQLKNVGLLSNDDFEKVVSLLNSSFLLGNANVRQMIREIVISYLNNGDIQPLKTIFQVSVSPDPMGLVQDIYELFNPEQKEIVAIVYQEYLRVRSEIEKKTNLMMSKMNQSSIIQQITVEEIQEGWQLYDSSHSELTDFIKEIPAAKIAHDAAVNAMNAKDNEGRAVWEGFLRCLYIVAKKMES
jgi:hypothetical protein